jgi:hypothetical protein
VIDFCRARLRSNPRFRLIPHDRLAPPQRNEFKSLSEDPDFFGVLLPSEDSKYPAKSVSRDAALLFLALAEPACLPHLLAGLFGSVADDRLRQLVLDGVLEVEQADRFVSGAEALKLLTDERGRPPASRVAQLSSDAIAYATALQSLELHQVAGRLYRFNAAPSTPALQRRFATTEGQLALVSGDGAAARQLRTHWRSEPVEDSWLAWSGPHAQGAAYKLYVSPVLDDLPAVFAAATESFSRTRCTLFKLGLGAYGVLRPDKLVAYFGDLDQLLEAAERIQRSAGGARAQGVPFSAPIDADGLVSWGMDPPRFEQERAGREYQSWRHWLTERVAVYATAAGQSGTDAQAFVRARIALDGVDPSSWNPNLAIWRGPVGTEQEVA